MALHGPRKPLHDNAVTFRWRQTRKAAGCPSVRLHGLRSRGRGPCGHRAAIVRTAATE